MGADTTGVGDELARLGVGGVKQKRGREVAMIKHPWAVERNEDTLLERRRHSMKIYGNC